ncbi:10944_t:CDS:2 [Funneliformis geosporum]|uniref:13749_t:CDS:1 n=1 Tax=Funneliformis geosporum TaxID=1117311 RepID=A0A9W4SW80_9GLOM|nr:10944_t:CDS:2 [Funneliformis geosporum]CAI2183742.1 13749_t:CDS:2 [Funneliformis geosporum]
MTNELVNQVSTEKNYKKKYVLSKPVSDNNESQSNESHSTVTNETKPKKMSVGLETFLNDYNKYKYWYIGIIILLIALALVPGPDDSSGFFRKLSETITGISRDIDRVHLPATNKVMDHVVACRRAANMIRSSPAFTKYGVQISSGLISFGEKIVFAGRELRNMYSKGSSLYESFDIEIDAMMQRLNLNARQGDSRYFKDRLNNLIIKVGEYRNVVDKTLMAVKNAEDSRHSTEGYIITGMREAEKFVTKSREHSVDIARAHKELEAVNEVLIHLKYTAGNLMKMREILEAYEDRILDLASSLDKPGKDDDFGIFDVTKKDLNYLSTAVNQLKGYHHSFNKKARISN